MFGEAGRGEEEEEANGFFVAGVPRNALRMAADDHDATFKEIADGIAGVGKREAFADCGRMKFFAIGERLPKGQLFGRAALQFGNELDQFAQRVVLGLAAELEVDGFGVETFSDDHAPSLQKSDSSSTEFLGAFWVFLVREFDFG